MFWGVAGGVLAVILIAVGIFLIVHRPRIAPKADEIDLSPIEGDLSETYTPVETATDLVRLTVSYTAKAGEKEQGDIYIRLFPDVAPETVANFKSLVGSGFYNGTTFHRVYPGFMIQGGAPSGDGDSGRSIKGEFSKNGFENNLSHSRGVLSMARTNDPNSATSQFFIVHSDSAKSSLDGSYASFGYVVSGMDVVDAITEIELSFNAGGIDNVATSPVYPVTIESAVFVAKK
ncbi:MAG: peptidylprolyl isomerase [Ruminococcaceae bacterium]|nr:peptidylprolyl isomerase [Oscillospiraceae bacterium]